MAVMCLWRWGAGQVLLGLRGVEEERGQRAGQGGCGQPQQVALEISNHPPTKGPAAAQPQSQPWGKGHLSVRLSKG